MSSSAHHYPTRYQCNKKVTSCEVIDDINDASDRLEMLNKYYTIRGSLIEFTMCEQHRENRMKLIDLVITIFLRIYETPLVMTYHHQFAQTVILKINEFKNYDVSDWSIDEQIMWSALMQVCDRLLPLAIQQQEHNVTNTTEM